MKKIRIFLLVLAMLVFSAQLAGAQDVDLSQMDKEQLIELLQEIMQRLEEQDTTPEPMNGPVVTPGPAAELTETPVPTVIPTLSEQRTFTVYENKKLIIGQMPSYYFPEPTIEHQYQSPLECNKYCNKLCFGPNYQGEKCYLDCMKWCTGMVLPTPVG